MGTLLVGAERRDGLSVGARRRKDPSALLASIARDKITHLHFVPSMLDAFLNAIEAGEGEAELTQSLRTVFTSGEALTLHQSARFLPWLRRGMTAV